MPRKRLNPNIIRRGDRIRVVNPLFFVRCGYPKTFKGMVEEVEKAHAKDIHDLLKKVGLPLATYFSGDGGSETRAYRKIVSAIAYAKLRKERFGGSERKVYNERRDDLQDHEFRVWEIKMVKTGQYISGGWYSTLDGSEYEPAYLDSEKAHKILSVSSANFLGGDPHGLRIEAKNVEKIPIE